MLNNNGLGESDRHQHSILVCLKTASAQQWLHNENHSLGTLNLRSPSLLTASQLGHLLMDHNKAAGWGEVVWEWRVRKELWGPADRGAKSWNRWRETVKCCGVFSLQGPGYKICDDQLFEQSPKKKTDEHTSPEKLLFYFANNTECFFYKKINK